MIFFIMKMVLNSEIKERNWHIYLSNYGWNKLNKKWIVKLNKLTDEKKKNSTFGVLDCGGDGDCLFHCISYAINNNKDTDTQNLRFELSEYISEDKFYEIIDIYRILKDSNEFDESWDPESITFEEFKILIKEGGNNYWGDFNN